MAKIPFMVSARTARLIGRENVANAESAMIELIKNCYDADSKIVLLVFDIKYPEVPKKLTPDGYAQIKGDISNDILSTYYKNEGDNYLLNEALDTEKLFREFNKHNTIYLMDNGDGMNEDIIKKHWMTIGTDFKRNLPKSRSGRVHTGAKGIGRFSLDKLGEHCEMITIDQNSKNCLKWVVYWEDFEKDNLILSDVKADLTPLKGFDYLNYVKNVIGNSKIAPEIISNKFTSGTCFKITNLRDDWSLKNINDLFENLQALFPPQDIAFDIYLLQKGNEIDFGKVISSECDNYDYKIQAKCDNEGNVKVRLFRNEIELGQIDNKLFELPEMHEFPFDKNTFLNSEYIEKDTSLHDLMPGYKDAQVLKNIGPFEFNFYFLKRTKTSKDQDVFKYKDFNSSKRKSWLEQFGGIKLYRDNVRVRPYGEPKKGGFFDWLELGQRADDSPAGLTHKTGKWRVRAQQVAGSVHISRIDNSFFADKSSREGLQEVTEFSVFRKILQSIIGIFEEDRQHVARAMKSIYELENEEEQNKSEATQIAKSIISKKSPNANYSSNEEKLAKAITTYEKEIKEQNESLKLLRVLASTGLVITSFSHDFQNIRASIVSRNDSLKKVILKYISPKAIENAAEHHNPLVLLSDMKGEDEKLSNWLDFSLNIIKKDKRKRKKVDLRHYFRQLNNNWMGLLKDDDIELNITFSKRNKCFLTCFEMDLDAMFVNLISNSIASLNDESNIGSDKSIRIEILQDDEFLNFSYEDNGIGLHPSIKNPTKIFEPLFSTKLDKYGEQKGAGLGMWIYKNTLDEYSGKYSFEKVEKGFKITTKFPLKQGDGFENEI